MLLFSMSLLICVFLLVSSAAGQPPTWPNPIAEQVTPYLSTGLTHGPMLGRPAATSIRVWIRTEEATEFEIRYSTRIPLDDDSHAVRGKTRPDHDNTGYVDLADLKPFTRYYYGVVINGELAETRITHTDPWPSFRTLPNASTTHDPVNNPKGLFNLAFSLCVGASQDPKRSGGQYSDPPAWTTLHRQFADETMFHIMDGDYTYEELRDGTLQGVRGNYKLYMDRSTGMNRYLRSTPWLQMYDDHEVQDNLFGAGQVGFKRVGSRHINRDHQLKAWREYAGWANPDTPQRGPLFFGQADAKAGDDVLASPSSDFSALDLARVNTVLVRQRSTVVDARSSGDNAGTYGLVKVLDKHRIQVTPPLASSEPVDFSIGSHHYYDYRLGNCHLFVLDTRGERSKFNSNKHNDPKTFLLGETQRKWLLDGIQKSDADFFFIVSSVGVIVPHSAFHVRPELGDKSKGDGFPGFVHEREIILKALDEIDKPIMFFTGDVHASVSAQITDNIWEFMVAPFSSNGHPIGTLGNMPYTGWYNAEGRWVRIKWVASGPNNVHYSRLHRTFFAVVRVNNIFSCPRPDGEGPGYQHIAYPHPQATITWYDGYTGRQAYSETVSTLDLEHAPPNER